MEEISRDAVAEKYNNLEIIWHEEDAWHLHTKAMISKFIANATSKNEADRWQILNAGSAGYSYGLNEQNILHVDIAAKRLSKLSNSLVADIQNLPLTDRSFDLIICVGSVINYCDPVLVIKEFSRLLKPEGQLILEFENSFTLELLGKMTFNKKATLINSFYNGQPEKVWFFAERYIRELASLDGLNLVAIDRCHILSPLIYRVTQNERFAAGFRKFDKIGRYIPVLNKFSSNTICLFSKSPQC